MKATREIGGIDPTYTLPGSAPRLGRLNQCKNTVSIVQVAGRTSGPVWAGLLTGFEPGPSFP
jgi:hypothetical protein